MLIVEASVAVAARRPPWTVAVPTVKFAIPWFLLGCSLLRPTPQTSFWIPRFLALALTAGAPRFGTPRMYNGTVSTFALPFGFSWFGILVFVACIARTFVLVSLRFLFVPQASTWGLLIFVA